MKRTLQLKYRFSIAISLLTLCIVLLLSHWSNQKHIKRLHELLQSVHHDRLLATSYLFEYSQEIDYLEVLLRDSSIHVSSDQTQPVLDRINHLHHLYAATHFTPQELKLFRLFREECIALEKAVKRKDEKAISLSRRSHQTLGTLIKVQLEKASEHMKEAQQIMLNAKASGKVETGLLIIVALVVQVLMFAGLFRRLPRRIGSDG